jgi:hypothetical protein
MRRINPLSSDPAPDPRPALPRRAADHSNPGRCLRPLAKLLLELARARLEGRLAEREAGETSETQSGQAAE